MDITRYILYITAGEFVKKIVFLILYIYLALNIFGATRTWDAGAGGNWSLNTNWSGDILPVDGDDVVIDTAFIILIAALLLGFSASCTVEPVTTTTVAPTTTTTTTTTTIVPPNAPTIVGLTNGTYNTDQSFTVAGTDTLYYSKDNGTTWIAYDGQVTLSTEGSYTVKAKATNAGGSTISASNYTIVIDKTAPTVKITANYWVIPLDATGIVNADFTTETGLKNPVFSDSANTIVLEDQAGNKTTISNVYDGPETDGLRDAVTASVSGNTIYVTAGDYQLVDIPLRIDKDITLQGSGSDANIIGRSGDNTIKLMLAAGKTAPVYSAETLH